MTTNHVDQLAQWYADAERITDTNLPRIGDTLIFPYNADGYAVVAEEDDWTPDDVVPGESVRILARAPKPKPAWHNAVAVIAHVDDFRGAQRRVFVRRTADFGGICWEDEFSEWPPDDLIDPVPLIEAKVTDEMVERAAQSLEDAGWDTSDGNDALTDALAAALGLETE